jgi:hypothetical protein
MTFNTIRAFSIKPGDRMPAPLSWGGWDYSRALRVIAVSDADGAKVFTLETGPKVRALPMTRVPFLRGA